MNLPGVKKKGRTRPQPHPQDRWWSRGVPASRFEGRRMLSLAQGIASGAVCGAALACCKWARAMPFARVGEATGVDKGRNFFAMRAIECQSGAALKRN